MRQPVPDDDDRSAPGLRPEVYARLEKAVLEIFSQSDFHKANIRDVARRAGVSFTTIYKHYGSKERLLFSFVDIWLGKLTERIIDHLARHRRSQREDAQGLLAAAGLLRTARGLGQNSIS